MRSETVKIIRYLIHVISQGPGENLCFRVMHVGVNKSTILPGARNVLDAALNPVHRPGRTASSVRVHTAWHGVRSSAPRPPHSNGCPNQNLYRVYPSHSSFFLSLVCSLFFPSVLLFTLSPCIFPPPPQLLLFEPLPRSSSQEKRGFTLCTPPYLSLSFALTAITATHAMILQRISRSFH